MTYKITLAFLFTVTISLSTGTRDCKKQATFDIKRSAYEFSVKLLDRVSIETAGHFVYSPISTWLQLIALAEGASGRTLAEIWEVTKLERRRQVCYRRTLKNILLEFNYVTLESKRISIIIVDKLYRVKDKYKSRMESDNVKVLSMDFDKHNESAARVNEMIQKGTEGVIEEVITPNDFDLSTMLMIDAVYFKSNWRFPFNPVYTDERAFYTEEGVETGRVNMMNQISYFKMVEIPLINAKVLELPCSDERVSLLIFLPIANTIHDLYYLMTDTNLLGVFNQFTIEGDRLVNVTIPRFDVSSNLDVRELLFDMGVRRALYPESAQLKGISNFTINASLIAQKAKIQVTEKYVTANAAPEAVIGVTDPENVLQFTANRPFGFMLADRKTDFILFAGMYTEPSLY